jgi:hypothetical protein
METKHMCMVSISSTTFLTIFAILLHYQFVETKVVELQESAIEDAENVKIENGGIHASVFEGDVNIDGIHTGTITSFVLGTFILLGLIIVSVYQFLSWENNKLPNLDFGIDVFLYNFLYKSKTIIYVYFFGLKHFGPKYL